MSDRRIIAQNHLGWGYSMSEEMLARLNDGAIEIFRANAVASLECEYIERLTGERPPALVARDMCEVES